MSVKTYECEGCGDIFNGTAEEAFEAGWDTPERFISHCTCPNCPITVTTWWKAMVDKEQLSMEELKKIQMFNKIAQDM